MKTFSVTILGSSAAIAARNRGLSAQVLHYGNELFLIDCGEGTQFQLRKHKISGGHISHIFISHLHGDHFFGLIGLMSTWHLLRRTQPLHIYGPAPLKEILEIQLKASGTELNYLLHFHPVNADSPEVILNHPELEVSTLPLIHRLPTTGFLFREKKQLRRINREAIARYKVPFNDIEPLRRGADFTDKKGEVVANDILTLPAHEPRSYAYCSDTAYNEALIPLIANSTILYHEATFMHDRAAAAAEKGHSTSIEAAIIADRAGVGKLLLGHFSARYEDLRPLLEEAQTIFYESVIVDDGVTYSIE